MSRGRGRPVAGTSAKKNRAARRTARGETARLRRAGQDAPPAGLVDAEDLDEVAARARRSDDDRGRASTSPSSHASRAGEGAKAARGLAKAPPTCLRPNTSTPGASLSGVLCFARLLSCIQR